MFLTIITFILVLSILVFAHELGHFFTARMFGLKPREFGIGFPPRAFGVYKDKEGKWKKIYGKAEAEDASDTIYSLNWFPLGGFVNLGEDDVEAEGPDSFVGKKIWQRMIILAAGVSMNIVLAMFLIAVGFMIGMPQALDDVGGGARVSDRKIQIVNVIADGPAAKAGIKVGDVILDINGRQFSDYHELQKFADDNTGKDLAYKVKRNDKEVLTHMVPTYMQEAGRGGVGIGIAETGIVRYPFFIAIWEGVKTTVFLTWAILVAFYELFKGLILGHGLSGDIAGPVGIATMTGQAARMGFVYVLQFTAMLSINLAIINFLPFPALDGGRVLFLFIEKIKGRPVKREWEAVIHNVGFALLMVLVLFVTFKDISKFAGFFKNIFNKLF